MALEALTAGWFPPFAEEQASFDVSTDTISRDTKSDHAHERVTATPSLAARLESATGDGLPRLATNAVRYPGKDSGRNGEICLDISPHSNRFKGLCWSEEAAPWP